MFDWSYFDDIQCINLYSRGDRYEYTQEVFNKYNIPGHFYRVNKHPKSGFQGSFESHINCIRNAYNKGAQNVLIFEDDIDPSIYLTPDNLQKAVNFMKSHNYDIFFLGCFPQVLHYKAVLQETDPPATLNEKLKDNLPTSTQIYKIHAWMAHAYVISRPMMEKIKDLNYMGIQVDFLYSHNNNSYAILPSLFYQKDLPSDNDNTWYVRLKIRDNVNRLAEFYARYINYPVINIFVILSFFFFVLLIYILIVDPYRWIVLAVVIGALFLVFLYVILRNINFF